MLKTEINGIMIFTSVSQGLFLLVVGMTARSELFSQKQVALNL